MSALVLAFVIAVAAAPLAAQAPPGWKVRVDRSENAQDPDDTPNLQFMTMGAGIHVTGGPAGTFWKPADTVTGNYMVKATFNLQKPSGHTNYYGLVFGGSDLEGANQAYSYFVVAQDGTYQIRRRQGAMVTDIQPKTAHAAIRKPEGGGPTPNALEVWVGANEVSYVINGTVVHTTPRSAAGRTDGVVGVRVNHQLDVHIDGFQIQRRS
jgi:hypothetical protein